MSAHPAHEESLPSQEERKWSWSPAATSHTDSTKQAVKEHDEEKVGLDKAKDHYNKLVKQDQELRVKIAATNKLLFALMQEAGLIPEAEIEESMDLNSDAVADIIQKATRETIDN